jgi:hypothetical protein
MATPIESKLYAIDVVFDSKAEKKITFAGDIQNDDITVDSYMGLIVLRLMVAPGSQDAVFLTNPVEWFRNEIPSPTMPPPFSIQRDSAKQVTLIDINTNGTESGIPYGFRVLVQSGDQVYTSADPTVINKEPPTGELRSLSGQLQGRLQRRVA